MVCRKNGIRQLPEELLFTILGFLDWWSLCTARLVCRQFRQSASGHMKALRFDWAELHLALGISFTYFSSLTRVAVSSRDIWAPRCIGVIAHPRIAPFITHVEMPELSPMEVTVALPLLMSLPKLRSLSLRACINDMQLLPLWLEDLHVSSGWNFLRADASPLTRLSRLTSLDLRMEVREPTLRSLAGLANLRSLRLSEQRYDLPASGVLSTFTTLTSLTLHLSCCTQPRTTIFPDLARLTGLSHLELKDLEMSVRGQDVACLSSLTALTCLRLMASFAACVAGSSSLTLLTRLVSVWFGCCLKFIAHIPNLNGETLQSLTLLNVHHSVLQTVTGLTHLSFSCFGSVEGSRDWLIRAVARMSRLRSLELDLDSYFYEGGGLCLDRILQEVTSLTRLSYRGKVTLGRDMEACTLLPCLCSLKLDNCIEVTPTFLAALQAMTGLTELGLSTTRNCEFQLMPEVTAALNMERFRRGWPPLKFTCQCKGGLWGDQTMTLPLRSLLQW